MSHPLVRVKLSVVPTRSSHRVSVQLHNVARRRGWVSSCCWILLLLAAPPAAVLANLVLRRPSAPTLPARAVERVEMLANWATCDAVLLSSRACTSPLQPLGHERWAQLEADVVGMWERLLEPKLPQVTPYAVALVQGVMRATSAVHGLASDAHRGSCDEIRSSCEAWVCPLSTRGACVGSPGACKRLRQWCAQGSMDSSRESELPGGVGPPHDWEPPPAGWVPASVPVRYRGAHPWREERWAAAGDHPCVLARAPSEAEPSALPLERINDGWCDCRDGSDEPGTSACAGRGGRFWCVAASVGGGGGGEQGGTDDGATEARADGGHGGHLGATALPDGEWVDTGVVDDGVCDCCDCADEGALDASDGRAAKAREAACGHGQRSALSPLESWRPRARAEQEALHEAAAAIVRPLRLSSTLGARKMAADAQGMAQFLRQQPRSQQEYAQMRRIGQQHGMLTNALQHGTPRPLLLSLPPPPRRALRACQPRS